MGAMKTTTKSEKLEKLGELLKDIKYCMLTTVEKDGSLRSRPMYTQPEEDRGFNGSLWFLTGLDNAKVEEIKTDHQVNLSYVSENQKKFVSVSGKATVSKNRAKLEEFWKPYYRAWYPDGLEDPNLCLLKVAVDHAEYWETPSSAVAHLVGYVKSLVTGEEAKIGENEKIDVASR